MKYGSYGWGIQRIQLCSTYQGKIPSLVHLYIPHYFVVTSAPLLHDVVLLTLVHNVHHLDISGIFGPKGCVQPLTFVSSLWSLHLIHHQNSPQVNLRILVCLGIIAILVRVLVRKTFWQPVMPPHHYQTKPLIPWISIYHIAGEGVVPTYLWLIII